MYKKKLDSMSYDLDQAFHNTHSNFYMEKTDYLEKKFRIKSSARIYDLTP